MRFRRRAARRQVIWYLTQRLILRALKGAERLHGVELLLTVIERFMRDVQASPDLRHFLKAEPEAALRILTSKDGPIQQGMIDTVHRVLAGDEERDGFCPYLDRDTLAERSCASARAFGTPMSSPTASRMSPGR